MLNVDIYKQAEKFMRSLPPKQKRQIAGKIMELKSDPEPLDSKHLKGVPSCYRRADVGEYRIVYMVENNILHIVVVSKRNDDEVYKILKRKI